VAMMAKSWLFLGCSEQVKAKIQEIWQSLAVSVKFSAIAKNTITIGGVQAHGG